MISSDLSYYSCCDAATIKFNSRHEALLRSAREYSNFSNRLLSNTAHRHTFGMQVRPTCGRLARSYECVYILFSAYVTTACCLFTKRRRFVVLSFFLSSSSFYSPVDTTSSLAPPGDLSSLSFSFAFIKYKQFRTFRPTPERPAGHIFTTRHSGFCQLSDAPAPRHLADSPRCRGNV